MKLLVAVIKPFERGQVGDDVLDLQSAVRIRAGKTDAAAI